MFYISFNTENKLCKLFLCIEILCDCIERTFSLLIPVLKLLWAYCGALLGLTPRPATTLQWQVLMHYHRSIHPVFLKIFWETDLLKFLKIFNYQLLSFEYFITILLVVKHRFRFPNYTLHGKSSQYVLLPFNW